MSIPKAAVSWRHRLAHFFKSYTGDVVATITEVDDRFLVRIGYKCRECGAIEGDHLMADIPAGQVREILESRDRKRFIGRAE